MIIHLRAHHLLCILSYIGKGYSPEFVKNYDEIAQKLSAGAQVKLVAGPDDICAPMLSGPDRHCVGHDVQKRDEQAAQSIASLLGRSIAPGTMFRLTPNVLQTLRMGFADGGIRAACQGCTWSDLCDDIAASGFDGARVHSTE
ncbi:DUF1284 domain-containing protein [Aestuariibius sp. HNIBRBA575]|uniref:DUF1284 domain-containing protein n=1 Tax=Aestuariibius sp. HNIBRBA575 TaxID=3233343 RepID=UPI0034A15B72